MCNGHLGYLSPMRYGINQDSSRVSVFFTLFGGCGVVGGRGGIDGDSTYVDKPFWYQ